MDEGVSVLVQIIAVLDALLYMEYYLFQSLKALNLEKTS